MSNLKMSGLPDCGDNSCFFDRYRAEKPKGMRTNGGCRCKPHEWQRHFHVLLISVDAQRRTLASNQEEIERLRSALKCLVESAEANEEQLNDLLLCSDYGESDALCKARELLEKTK
jgi:hypothetical protein